MNIKGLEHYTYTPDPNNCVEPRDSNIHGKGVFATKHIHVGFVLGNSHVMIGCECIRRDFGGYINHSEFPNCEIVENRRNGNVVYYDTVAIKEIPKDTEITVSYFNSVCGNCKEEK